MTDNNRSDLAAAIAARLDKLELDLKLLSADLKRFGLQMSSEIVGKVPGVRKLVTDAIGSVQIRGDDAAAWAYNISEMLDMGATPLRVAPSPEGLGYDSYGKLVFKPVRQFFQVDGWANVEPGDCVMVPDSDGDVLMGGRTKEPQRSETTVRILIAADAKRDDVLRIIRKQLQWCERDNGILDRSNDTGSDLITGGGE